MDMKKPTLNESSDSSSGMGRRPALRLLALAGAGLFLSGGNSRAVFMDFLSSFNSPSPSALASLGLPTDWMQTLGSSLPSYAEYLHRLSLKNISVRQMIEPHTHIRSHVQNTLPPRALWGNIRSTLRVIDSLSARLDLKVAEVISIYRSPAYNAHCPGAKSNSYHLRNNAVDVVFHCAPGKVAAMARAMRSTGLFHGGVGRYANFTHIDTRGRDADWSA